MQQRAAAGAADVVVEATRDVVRAPSPARAATAQRRVVLAYHAIGSWSSELVVSEATLRLQARHFAEAGFEGLTVSESERRLADGDLPGRCVVFTFDDGFRSIIAAKRILDEFGFPGTAFVVTGFASSDRPLDWWGLHEALHDAPTELLQPLSWHDVEALSSGGWEIGSHTVSHPLLSHLSETDIEWQLSRSRQAISSRLGRCDSIAYPYGVPDSAIAEAARRAGYSSGWTLSSAHVVDEPFLRPRVGMTDGDVGLRLWAKTSSAGLRLRRGSIARLRARRRSRQWIPPA